MKNINKKNLIISAVLSLLGVAFLVYYIFRASLDVVASDYIRIINYYLKDVTDLHLLFSWEGISRIPFSFLARYVNVKFFNYSVYFDKILGTIGLFIFNTVTVYYVLNNLKTKLAKILGSLLTTYISFSLISWEMILNGTGYAHFITVGLIALTFYFYSKFVNASIDTPMGELCEPVAANYVSGKLVTLISLLIIITSLLFASSYAVSYLCVIIFFSIILFIYGIKTNRLSERYGIVRMGNKPFIKLSVGAARKRYYPWGKNDLYIIKYYPVVLFIIISIICLLLYFKSSNTGEVLIPVGFKDITLIELLKTNPIFPLKFLLKSLASSIVGVETFDYALNFGTINEKIIYLIGFIYLIIIIYALILLYRIITGAKHREPASHNITFILMFFVYGIANYALVFLARYKFVEDTYGMSSRYGIQYMFLTIAVIFILIKSLDNFIVKHHEPDATANFRSSRMGELREPADTLDSDIVGAKHREPVVWASYASSLKFKNIIVVIITIASIGFILLGHLTTNTDEIFKSDYRKIIYGILEDKAKNYKNLSDEDLENSFEFHRGPDQIKEALSTLEEQHLNVFRK